MRPKLAYRARGQALVLFALCMILVVAMSCITIAIAVRTRERLEQQTIADTVAYSNAIAVARTYNGLSIINRTALSHWVSLMAVQANASWASLHKVWFESIADALGEFDPPGAPSGICATQRQKEIKDARHSLLHAALSSYNGPGAGGDNVNLNRGHDPGCTLYDERKTPWWKRDFGMEDARVADESRKIYSAIDDLTQIQDQLHRQLEKQVKEERIANGLVKQAGGGAMAPYRFLKGTASGVSPAWDNVDHALGRGVSDDDDVRKESLIPLAHAAMGSRPVGYLVGGADQDNPPDTSNRVKPPWTLELTRDIQADLNQHFGVDKFKFEIEHFAVRSYLGKDPDTTNGIYRVHSGMDLGFGNVAGSVWGRIVVHYRGPCGTPHKKTIWPEARIALNRAGTSVHEFGHFKADEGLGTGTHASKYGYCHPDHRHWGEVNGKNTHYLQGKASDSIWPEGFGFVFPQNPPDEKNFPVFGQPVMPVFLARDYRNVPLDPWNLTVRMRFNPAGPGAGVTIDPKRVPDQAVFATAILYYHRRRPDRAGFSPTETNALDEQHEGTTGWRESPNLLNPYWHATLVRSDLGENGTQTRPNVQQPKDRLEHQMLQAEGFGAAAEAYRELYNAGFRSWQ